MSIEVNNGIVTEKYEMGESPFIFIDAIVIPKDEYDRLTKEEIEEIKLSRYQAWYDFVTRPEPDPNPLDEDAIDG